jgi:hypothetical protein
LVYSEDVIIYCLRELNYDRSTKNIRIADTYLFYFVVTVMAKIKII